jgi:hypothetical protein
VAGVRRLRSALVVLTVVAAVAGALSASPASAVARRSTKSCSVLTSPRSLGATLLRLHRDYMRHQPEVRNPTITGPVGRIHLGSCGGERYALATFDARYNGLYFGAEDQPERFVRPHGKGWKDIGNTGGSPCGAAPTALVKAWKLVSRCPG